MPISADVAIALSLVIVLAAHSGSSRHNCIRLTMSPFAFLNSSILSMRAATATFAMVPNRSLSIIRPLTCALNRATSARSSPGDARSISSWDRVPIMWVLLCRGLGAAAPFRLVLVVLVGPLPAIPCDRPGDSTAVDHGSDLPAVLADLESLDRVASGGCVGDLGGRVRTHFALLCGRPLYVNNVADSHVERNSYFQLFSKPSQPL